MEQNDAGLYPARHVIAKCGGVLDTAKLVGKHRTTVVRWMRPKAAGGTGGLVPAEHQRTLLEVAPANDIDLTPDDFFFVPSAVDAAQ